MEWWMFLWASMKPSFELFCWFSLASKILPVWAFVLLHIFILFRRDVHVLSCNYGRYLAKDSQKNVEVLIAFHWFYGEQDAPVLLLELQLYSRSFQSLSLDSQVTSVSGGPASLSQKGLTEHHALKTDVINIAVWFIFITYVKGQNQSSLCGKCWNVSWHPFWRHQEILGWNQLHLQN